MFFIVQFHIAHLYEIQVSDLAFLLLIIVVSVALAIKGTSQDFLCFFLFVVHVCGSMIQKFPFKKKREKKNGGLPCFLELGADESRSNQGA